MKILGGSFFRRGLCLAAICCVLVLALACASTEEREQRLLTRYPDWDPEMARQAAARNVAPGMTQEMVEAALGRRGEESYDPQTGMQVWTYYKEVMMGMYPRWVPAYQVFFKEGRVVATEGDRRYVPSW